MRGVSWIVFYLLMKSLIFLFVLENMGPREIQLLMLNAEVDKCFLMPTSRNINISDRHCTKKKGF